MILPKVELTPAGRPKLSVGEIERVLLDKVDLEFEGIGGTEGCQTADRYQDGYVVCTNHRVIWIDAAATPTAGRSCHLAISSIHSTRKHVQYGLNVMNPKVRLEFKVFVDLASKPTNMQCSASFRYLQLRCRGEGPDAFNEHLNAAMEAHKQQQARQQQAQQLQQQQQHHWSAPPSPSFALKQQQMPPWGVGISSGASYLSSSAAAQGPVSDLAPPSPSMSRPLQAVDKQLLDSLVEMGFPRPRVIRALLATQNENMQAALDWILAAGEDSSMDKPLKQQEPAAVSREELRQLHKLQQQQQTVQQGVAGSQQNMLPGWGVGTLGAVAAAAAAGGGGVVMHPAGPTSVPLYNSYSDSSITSGTHDAAAYSQQQHRPHRSSAASGVIGVAGIMHREAEKSSKTSANLAVAFRDLDNLMGMAAEMVKLAERFRGVMSPDGTITLTPGSIHGSQSAPAALNQAVEAPAAAQDSSGQEQLLLDAETQLQLIAMGIASPVTKASAGARYYQELSRQLADFLSGPLAAAGGVMLLPDVYCLFNRARGTELVSPDDMMQACEAFQQVGLPLRLRTFPSGVIVVQGSQFSDTQLCKNIEQLLYKKSQQQSSPMYPAGLGPPVSAGDVSAALRLPLTLAKEALLVAEARGVLCRDDGPEGLRFFVNFFKEAEPVLVQ